MQCLGSNIFQIVQLAPLYLYESQKSIESSGEVRWNKFIISAQHDSSQLIYSTSDLLSLQEQSEICMSIILKGLRHFDYPFFSQNVLFNPYEIITQDQAIGVFELQPLICNNQVAVTINPYKIKTCKGNGAEKVQRIQSKSNFRDYDKLKGRVLIPLIFISKQLTIEEVILEDGSSELIEFYQTRHKIVVQNTSILFRTSHKGRYKFIFAELCMISKRSKTIYNDCYSYVAKLKLWNQLISQNLKFLEFLKDYQLILTAKPQTFKLQMLDPGHLKFCEGTSKHLNQLVMSRSIQDFEQSYSDAFLGEKTLFTSNLELETWHVLSSAHENQISSETQKKFLSTLQTITSKKQYKLPQPITIKFSSSDTIEQIIGKVSSLKTSMILVLAQKDVIQRMSKELKKYCFEIAVPIQFIWLPFYEPTCAQLVNRTIAKIAGQIGSVGWSMEEIKGRFLDFKATCFAGLSVKKVKQSYLVALVMSVNKSITKYTSTFDVSENLADSIKKCFKETLFVFNKSQKIFPDFICLCCEALEITTSKEVHDILQEVQEDLQDIHRIQGSPYNKAILVVTQLRSESKFRCFHLPDEEIVPQSAQNVTLGAYVQLSTNVFLLALQRDYNACPYMTEIEIHNETEVKNLEMQLVHLIYRLTYLNCQLNFKTFLPAPLQYSFQLLSALHNQKADLKASKVQMLSGKLFYI